MPVGGVQLAHWARTTNEYAAFISGALASLWAFSFVAGMFRTLPIRHERNGSFSG